MVHTGLKVMNICLWYLDSGCSRNMTGDRSLFETFEPKKKLAMLHLVMEENPR